MTIWNDEPACLHLGPLLQYFSDTHNDAVELVADAILDALNAEDPESYDFAVVEAYDGEQLDAVELVGYRGGPVLFTKGRLPYGSDVLAFVHRDQRHKNEMRTGDRIQWLATREAFTTFAHNVSDAISAEHVRRPALN